MKILSVNAGSSSLKFRLFEMPEEKVLAKGTFEKIGSNEGFYSISVEDTKVKEQTPLNSHTDAFKILFNKLIELEVIKSFEELSAIGHRIVHGGDKYAKSVVIDEEVIKVVEELIEIAPLHNPANLVGISAVKELAPTLTNVGCFDTAFHQSMPKSSYLYAVPMNWYNEHSVRKYGFHGMSHKFITERMGQILDKTYVNLIICHIGNGASVTAVKDSKCLDTSMGFSPNCGLIMGTRSGDFDYSLINYIMKRENLTLNEVDSKLNKESGLFALSGFNDLRDLDDAYLANKEDAVLAVDMYTNRIVEYIAKYYVKLVNVDAVVFTAGVGENDSIIRREVLNKLSALGIEVDEDKNEKVVTRNNLEGVITKDSSDIPVYVLGTDEELMIARDTYELIK